MPASPQNATSILGGLAAKTFMREHWHKKWRHIAQAIPDFSELLEVSELLDLACRDGVESRLIIRDGKKWAMERGPFKAARLKKLPARDWTLLIQGLNLHLPAADALLRRFNFLPQARLDDVMVSIAAPGGGVGPHFDSYDVFLLQGIGTRRWKISEQTDLSLQEGVPLKILKKMNSDAQFDLTSGDMLYLPPHVAHDGVAVQESGFCTTYSIGFRAPTHQEIADTFLQWLTDTTELEGRLSDPDLVATDHPAKIPASYVREVERAITKLEINRSTIAQFAGCFATEPKQSVVFDAPDEPVSRAKFAKLAASGVRLDAATLCGYDDLHLYVNGDPFVLMGDAAFWHELADQRVAKVSASLDPQTLDALYAWYEDGWLHFASA
ncbi:MAG: cupin domain-containing protein [Betaproteobacteria bacterium]|nr:MAG: cupin domain-containing protein [Betaproteobacteria bacterium]